MKKKSQNIIISKSTIVEYVIYPFNLLVIVGDKDYIEERIKVRYPDELEDDYVFMSDELMIAKVEMFEDGLTVMAFNGIPNAGLIAHEALHAVDFLMHKIGNSFIGESWNYLLQYIVDEVTKFIKNG